MNISVHNYDTFVSLIDPGLNTLICHIFVWNEDMRVWMDVFVLVLHQYIVLSLVTVIWYPDVKNFSSDLSFT